MQHISRLIVLVKRLLIFSVSVVAIGYIYLFLLPDVWQNTPTLFSLVFIWLFTAYIALPRAHRLLSRIYLPNYFLGRARTADGLLADPVNLAINANKRELTEAMHKAGWQPADPITLKTAWRIAYASIMRKSYPQAPVSDMFLFGNKQDLAYQKEVKGNPRQRHHVRFWQAPKGWNLQGGYKVDWLGAATYDDAVGVSIFTLQFTHSIDANVDEERDYLIKTLNDAKVLRNTTKIKHFFAHYQTHNLATGNRYLTDGSFVIADLTPQGKPSAAQLETSHMNLQAMQQELSNLMKADNKNLDDSAISEIIYSLNHSAKILDQARKSKDVTKDSIKILIDVLKLLTALDKNADSTYREYMDRQWKNTKERINK